MKKWYLAFIEKKEKSWGERVLWTLFYGLSLVYGAVIVLRNWGYTLGLIPSYQSSKKVISIGNLSWAGAGKTTLAIDLAQKLSDQYRIAVLRKGYGKDEGYLLQEKVKQVFSHPNRVKLAKQNHDRFDLFILDDGFQYRRLRRNCDIVMMGARELTAPRYLIPAHFFREPFSSLNRADILLLTYKDALSDLEGQKARFVKEFPHLSVFSARYRCIGFSDRAGNPLSKKQLTTHSLAAVTGIGHPNGFFDQIKKEGITVTETKTYPDHYELAVDDVVRLEKDLLEKNITGILITEKDLYHIPSKAGTIPVFIMKIEIVIDDNDRFLSTVKEKLS